MTGEENVADELNISMEAIGAKVCERKTDEEILRAQNRAAIASLPTELTRQILGILGSALLGIFIGLSLETDAI
ncbi:hypothetical protein BDZ45DRAFT_751068 [Acephala macrosclerotiorum]|nr:hypothetical protein BDZ45DRAFT_751068 [Acephala macrosclerotiorum]